MHPATPINISRKLARLPRRARAAGAALLVAAAAPAVAALVGIVEPGARAALSEHRYALAGLELCLAISAVVGFHAPRSASPLAYARELRARFLELQSTYDADSRRRSDGKEKEDDLEVSPEP